MNLDEQNIDQNTSIFISCLRELSPGTKILSSDIGCYETCDGIPKKYENIEISAVTRRYVNDRHVREYCDGRGGALFTMTRSDRNYFCYINLMDPVISPSGEA